MIIEEVYNQRRRRPLVIYSIAVICTLLLVSYYLDANEILVRLGFVPATSDVVDAVSALFVHAGLFHYIGNMFYLYSYGDNIEDLVGHWLFVPLFLALGLSATYTYSLLHADSEIPLVGASGAISGILGMYAVLFPRVPTTIRLFGSNFEMPVAWSLAIWFGIQIFLTLVVEPLEVTAVAYSAHAGGFFAGLTAGALARALRLHHKHGLRLVESRKSQRDILCPACNGHNWLPAYGRYVCRHCRTEFLFDRNGTRAMS